VEVPCGAAGTSAANASKRATHVTLDPADILRASILIVDDDRSNVQLLAQVLGEAGYVNLSSTLHPQEVCALQLKNAYDLILLDLQMPDVDGFQVMADLRTNAAESHLPVIALTAQPGHKVRALQCGAKDFISKPFEPIEVKTRIQNMLEVRLLYQKLEKCNEQLEQTVQERTAELRESEARYRCLTELACDWYWEQDENGNFTQVAGPVLEMLGIAVNDLVGKKGGAMGGWDEAALLELQSRVAARQPFLDFVLSRVNSDGSRQRYRLSGQPMFNRSCGYIGYRRVGVELNATT
jgi:PAS domain S-box-containing protein